MLNTIKPVSDRAAAARKHPSGWVERDCRRGEARRDVAAVLAAFDEGASTQDRVLNSVVDRLLRAMRS